MKNKTAQLFYETYCAAVGGKAFNGDPLPSWEVFAADPNKKIQSDGWLAVAEKSLSEFPWGVFANNLTAEKAKHVCQNSSMTITGVVVTKTMCPTEEGLVAIVDKGAVRWLKKDEAWHLMHGDFITGGKIESLVLGDDVIVLITVPRTQALTLPYTEALKDSLHQIFPPGQRIFIKNEDMSMGVLHELLTAEDLANLSARLEQRKLSHATGPDQQPA